jgi:hypothetical protein
MGYDQIKASLILFYKNVIHIKVQPKNAAYFHSAISTANPNAS